MFSFSRLRQSFKDALRGLIYVFKTEQNFRVQTVCAVLLLIISCYFPLYKSERIILVLLAGLVLIMELLNTVLEHFVDVLVPRLHVPVGIIKDIMAGAVFVTSLLALSIGSAILLPYFLSLAK